MQELERLEGIVLYVTFQSQDTGFTVLELETETDVVTVVGEMLADLVGILINLIFH